HQADLHRGDPAFRSKDDRSDQGEARSTALLTSLFGQGHGQHLLIDFRVHGSEELPSILQFAQRADLLAIAAHNQPAKQTHRPEDYSCTQSPGGHFWNLLYRLFSLLADAPYLSLQVNLIERMPERSHLILPFTAIEIATNHIHFVIGKQFLHTVHNLLHA